MRLEEELKFETSVRKIFSTQKIKKLRWFKMFVLC